jgi:type I restriction enzyme S subunit
LKNGWREVRLAEVLTPVAREEPVDPSKEYALLGVRLDGRGAFLRERIMGSQSAASRLYRVKLGDFIYSRLFASRGAFGVIDGELDGCYVSSEFPTFRPVENHIDPDFLRYWFRQPSVLQRVLEDCAGSTPLTRNRYKEEYFLDLVLRLPSPENQQRILTRIDRVNARLQSVQQLHDEVGRHRRRLLIAMAHRADLTPLQRQELGWRGMVLRACMREVDESIAVESGATYPNVGMYSYARGLFEKPAIDGLLTSATSLRRIRAGQFIYSRLFAFEGAYGVVDERFDGYYVSQEYPTFECDQHVLRPAFLAAFFKSPRVWKELAAGSKGLGDRRQRVQPARILEYEIEVPPLEWQERIVSVSTAIARVEETARLVQPATEAFLPAVLDRAFKGKL